MRAQRNQSTQDLLLLVLPTYTHIERIVSCLQGPIYADTDKMLAHTLSCDMTIRLNEHLSFQTSDRTVYKIIFTKLLTVCLLLEPTAPAAFDSTFERNANANRDLVLRCIAHTNRSSHFDLVRCTIVSVALAMSSIITRYSSRPA